MKYQCVNCGKLFEQPQEKVCPHCGGKLQEQAAPKAVRPSQVAYVKYADHKGDSQR